ncbi:MAG TPA: TolC family protein [Tepidisphaeraceae bacterium]|jgi:cobalt-zinc-cadmium efflux system outer membrane protein
MNRRLFFALALGACVAGCAAPARKEGFSDVQQLISARTGQRIEWNQDQLEDQQAHDAVAGMLTAELTPQTSVQIALLNNRSLQATYEELGIAQAEVVQAGLLSNPIFGASLRGSVNGGGPDVQLGVAQDFLDIFNRPLRKRMAKQEFEQAKLRVAQEVLKHASEVEIAFYALQGNQQLAAMRKTMLDAARATHQLARQRFEAGNINELDFAIEEASYHASALAVSRADAEVRAGHQRLNRLLGLWGAEANWKIADKLPALPAEEQGIEELEDVALGRRLDLKMARNQIASAEQALRLTRRGIVNEVKVGASYERDPGGSKVLGPTVELPLPLFDHGQGRMMKQQAQLRLARRRKEALEVDVRADVHAAREKFVAADRTARFYQESILPQQKKILELSQQQYNAMGLSVTSLLAAKTSAIAAETEYIEALQDYWIARAELKAAVGGDSDALEARP